MAKRKRNDAANGGPAHKTAKMAKSTELKPETIILKAAAQTIAEPLDPIPPRQPKSTTTSTSTRGRTQTIQIITGSYDHVLHGLTAEIKADGAPTSSKTNYSVSFADSFLFGAHTSAVRCLALSPPSTPSPGQTQKLFLATGSGDERINVYSLSAHPPRQTTGSGAISSLAPRPILENRKNRELGTLLHHSSGIASLSFPNRSKLLSASEDSTVGVTRTRDWSLLSAIKVPVAKTALQGRPSGDTASYGTGPSGVNDFAVHPSMKLMISVSKGERCMRLWNLMTGKKAGVLNFGKEMLREVGEGRHSTGEGRLVVWGGGGGGGGVDIDEKEEEEEFAVAFDKDVVVFGMDSVPKCRVMGGAGTKVHRVRYLGRMGVALLVVSTDDGRVLFYDTRRGRLAAPAAGGLLSRARLVGQLGGKADGVTGRIKDFVILDGGGSVGKAKHPTKQDGGADVIYVVGGSSDGRIRLWVVDLDELRGAAATATEAVAEEVKQVGRLQGTYETQNRITCVVAFVMIPRPEGAEDSEDEEDEEQREDGDDSSDVDEPGSVSY